MGWSLLGRETVARTLNAQLVMLAFLFVLIGYGTKAGLAPMHTWLPDGHGEAPSPVSALLSGVLLVRGRRSDPAAKRSRGAFKRLQRRLGKASKAASLGGDFQEPALEALRDYIGDKLDRTGATITALDIEMAFGERGVPDELTGALLEIIHALEAGAYAGAAFGPTDPESLTKRIGDTAKKIDRII